MNEDNDFFESVVEADQALNPVAEGIKDGFQTKVKAARELLEKKGEWVGMCKVCFGTNHIFLESEGYQAITYTQETKESPITLMRCSHGRDTAEGYNY